MCRVALVLLVSFGIASCHAAIAAKPPQVREPGWQISLIAVEPKLVTPTGCCFDSAGRLLVIECHTHFPSEDYDGPKTDRIFRFEDSDEDGVRRVFFRAQCANCHQHTGRGSKTGPDLSTLAANTTVERIVESILQPSNEIAPMYVSWQVVTTDGAVLTGLKLNKSGVGRKAVFQAADGTEFIVPNEDVELQRPIQQSIMPAGLERTMTLQELNDLVAFLAGNTTSDK